MSQVRANKLPGKENKVALKVPKGSLDSVLKLRHAACLPYTKVPALRKHVHKSMKSKAYTPPTLIQHPLVTWLCPRNSVCGQFSVYPVLQLQKSFKDGMDRLTWDTGRVPVNRGVVLEEAGGLLVRQHLSA